MGFPSPLQLLFALVLIAGPSLAEPAVGHWTFDSGLQSEVGSWTGTVQGSASIGNGGAVIGGCYRGSNNGYLQTNLNGVTGSAPRSVSIWFRTDGTTGPVDALWGWGGTGTGDRYDLRLQDGHLRLEIGWGYYVFTLPDRLDDGEWHHAVLVYRGNGQLSDHSLYIDGRFARNASGTNAVNTAISPIRIGTGSQRGHGGNAIERDFSGWLDDFAIFDEALNATEVALLHGLGRIGGINASQLTSASSLWQSDLGTQSTIGSARWAKTNLLNGAVGDVVSLSTGGQGVVLDAPELGLAEASGLPESWIDFADSGSIRLLLFNDRIARFDTASGAWLADLPLPLAGPTAITASDSRIFISYGSSIHHYASNLSGGSLLATASEEVSELLLDGELLFAVSQPPLETRVVSIDTRTGATIDQSDDVVQSDHFRGVSLDPETRTIFASRSPLSYHSRIGYLRYDFGGNFLEDPEVDGSSPPTDKAMVIEGAPLVAHSDGLIHSVGDIAEIGDLGIDIHDACLLSENAILILSGNRLLSFSFSLTPLGEMALPIAGDLLRRNGNRFFVFADEPDGIRGYQALEVDVSSLVPATPPLPDPADLGTPHFDAMGNLCAYAQSYGQVLRWSPAIRDWVEPVAIPGAPPVVSWWSDRNGWIAGYEDGSLRLITESTVGDPFFIQTSSGLQRTTILEVLPVDSRLVVGTEFRLHSVAPDGQELDRFNVNSIHTMRRSLQWHSNRQRLAIGVGASLDVRGLDEEGRFVYVTSDTDLPGSAGFAPSWSPERIVSETGVILDFDTLSSLIRLGSPVLGSGLAGDSLFVLRDASGATVLERRDPDFLHPIGQQIVLPERPVRLIGDGTAAYLLTEVANQTVIRIIDGEGSIFYRSPAPAPSAQAFALTSTTSSSADFAWRIVATETSGYRLDYRVIDGSWIAGPAVGADADVASLDSLTPGTSYEARLVTLANGFEVLSEETIEFTLPPDDSLPNGEPYHLRPFVIGASFVELRWDDQLGDEQGFRIWRSDFEGGPYTPVAELSPNSTKFRDPDVDLHTSYFYQVEAFGPTGEGRRSAPVEVLTDYNDNIPSSPVDVQARLTPEGQVRLDWNLDTASASSFTIEWNTTGGLEGDELLELDGEARTAVFPPPARGVELYFRIVAINEQGWRQSTLVRLYIPEPAGSYTGDTRESGGVRYFGFESPHRLERYDLAQRRWLEPIRLPARIEGFWVDDEVFITGQEDELVEFPLNGGPSRVVTVIDDPPATIFRDGDWIGLQSARGYSIIHRLGGQVGAGFVGTPSPPLFQDPYTAPFASVLPAPSGGGLVATTPDASILRFSIGAGGSLPTPDQSPATGRSARVTRLVASPATGSVLASFGVEIPESATDTIEALGFNFTDASTDSQGTRLFARDRMLVGFDSSGDLIGRKRLEIAPISVGVGADAAAVFFVDPASPTGIRVAWHPFSDFGVPTPITGVDPEALTFTPDRCLLGADGVVYLPSREHSAIFRWSLPARDWLPTVNLVIAPSAVCLGAGGDSLMIAGEDRTIRRLSLADIALEAIPLHHESADPMAIEAVESFLLLQTRGHSRSLGSTGGLISSMSAPFYDPGGEWGWSPDSRRWITLNIEGDRVAAITMDPHGALSSSRSGSVPAADRRLFVSPHPSGDSVMLSPGVRHTTSSLDEIDALPEELDGMVWEGSDIVGISSVEDRTLVSRFQSPSWAPPEPLALHGGAPIALFRSDDGWLLVTRPPSGLRFTLLNEAFVPDFISPAIPLVPGEPIATRRTHTSIDLSWEDRSDDESEFGIEFRIAGVATWTELPPLPAGTHESTIGGLAPDTIYEIRVFAANATGRSPASEVLMARTLGSADEPAGEPYELTVLQAFEDRIVLEWNDNAANESGFRIIRESNSLGTVTFELPANSTQFTDTIGVRETYRYRVQAFNGVMDGELSDPTVIQPPQTGWTPPYSRRSPVIDAVGARFVTISWEDVSLNEEGFLIMRSENGIGGPWTEVGRTGFNITTFTDASVLPETTYSYRIDPYNANGSSEAFLRFATTTTSPLSGLFTGLSSQSEERCYFAFESENFIARYDLASETWLERVNLEQAPTALWTGAGAVYVATGDRIIRFMEDVPEPTLLHLDTNAIATLFATQGMVGFTTTTAPQVIQWIDALSGTPLGTLELEGELFGPDVDPETGSVFGRCDDRIVVISFNDSSPLGAANYAELLGNPVEGQHTTLLRSGNEVADSRGWIFETDALDFRATIGRPFDHLAEASDGRLIASRENQLFIFDHNRLESGSIEIPGPAALLVSTPNGVSAFVPNPSNPDGFDILAIAPDHFLQAKTEWTEEPVAPAVLRCETLMLGDGMLGFFDGTDSILYRWDLNASEWLPAIIPPDNPTSIAYSAMKGRVYTSGPTFTIRSFDPTVPNGSAPALYHSTAIAPVEVFDEFLFSSGETRFTALQLLRNLDGIPVATFSPWHSSGEFGWARDRREFFAADQGAYWRQQLQPDGAIVPGSEIVETFSNEYGPLMVSPDGTLIARRSGHVVNRDLNHQHQFDPVRNIAWVDTELVTIDSPDSETAMVTWLDPDFSTSKEVLLPGRADSIHPLAGGSLIVVTRDSTGYRIFTILENGSIFDSASLPPKITSAPIAKRAAFGSTVRFTVDADGSPGITFQWLKDGTEIEGETRSELVLPNAGSGDVGVYSVRITNRYGSVVSPGVDLRVGPSPVRPFAPQTLLVASTGGLEAYSTQGASRGVVLEGDDWEPIGGAEWIGDIEVGPLGRLHVLNKPEIGEGTRISSWDPESRAWTHVPVSSTGGFSDDHSQLDASATQLHTTRNALDVSNGIPMSQPFQSLLGPASSFSISPTEEFHVLNQEDEVVLLDPTATVEILRFPVPKDDSWPILVSAGDDRETYLSFLSGEVVRYSATGTELRSSSIAETGFNLTGNVRDLDFLSGRRLAIVDFFGDVFLTTPELNQVAHIVPSLAGQNRRTTWVPHIAIPAPAPQVGELNPIEVDGIGYVQLAGLHPDPDAILTWSIFSVENPDLFPYLDIDPATGLVSYEPASWISGQSEVTVRATDQNGQPGYLTFALVVADLPEPDLQLAEQLILNRQTGLYEHPITVTNEAAREIAGFDLAISGLPQGVEVYNASSCNDGNWCVQHRQPLAAGASVTLVLEYYAPIRGTVIDPEVTVALVAKPELDPDAAEPGLAVDRCEMLDDGLLIEFTAIPGALYEIQYSDDTTHWKQSPTRIRAAGNRVQWIDRGPPRTDSPPTGKSSRFYRVRQIPEIE